MVSDVPAARDPMYDVIFLAAPLDRARICSADECRDFLVDSVSRLRELRPGWRIAVKPHPNHSETFGTLAARHPGVDVLTGWSAAKAIARGRIFLSFGSTMLIDVWYSGRTGICIMDEPFHERLGTSMVYRLAVEHGAAAALLGDSDDELARKLEGPYETLTDVIRREYHLSAGEAAGRRIAGVVFAASGRPAPPVEVPM
jgi:hypothetical protein